MAMAMACIPPILLIMAMRPPTARMNTRSVAFQLSVTVPTMYVSQVLKKAVKTFPPSRMIAPTNIAVARDKTTCLVIKDKTIARKGVARERSPK